MIILHADTGGVSHGSSQAYDKQLPLRLYQAGKTSLIRLQCTVMPPYCQVCVYHFNLMDYTEAGLLNFILIGSLAGNTNVIFPT